MNRWMVVTGGLMLALLPAMHGMAMGMMDSEYGSMLRHRHVMHNGIGAEYANRESPIPRTDDNLRAGRQLYQQNCVACHGKSGRGEGPAAASMDPPPANLAAVVQTRMATDGYLYWAIAEGGAPLGTPMPAYKDILAEEQIWQLIQYLRTLR